jgi:S-adenosylmethionine:tRNA ribosyltransferase-isomerase
MHHPLAQYHYSITEKNIGRTPKEPRHDARLFVYDTATDTVTFDTFLNIDTYLPKNSLMVLNNTGVIPARVVFTKDTGGKIDGLVLINEGFDHEGAIPVIVDKNMFPGRRIALGDYWFTITRQRDQRFYIKPDSEPERISEILEQLGTTPTPYYLGDLNMTESQLRDRYQTTFAQNKKSVAAPTASLHITPEVLNRLENKGIVTTEITLDVGLGTFADIEQINVDEKFLHSELLFISSESRKKIYDAKQVQHPIIAVGTTVVRTLESQSTQLLTEGNDVIATETNIFIMPGYDFKIVDHLVTNFHVPESSLMALVDAFLVHKKSKRELVELYQIAIDNGFLFYSFGDSMLII